MVSGDVMTREADEGGRRPLPADFICPACGYDLSGAMVERCSECGLEITEDVLDALNRRRRFKRRYRWIALFALLVVIAWTTVVACFTDGGFDLPSILFGILVSAAVIGPGIIVTAIGSFRVARRERSVAFLISLLLVLVMQLPLLVLLTLSIPWFRSGQWKNDETPSLVIIGVLGGGVGLVVSFMRSLERSLLYQAGFVRSPQSPVAKLLLVAASLWLTIVILISSVLEMFV